MEQTQDSFARSAIVSAFEGRLKRNVGKKKKKSKVLKNALSK